MKDANSAALFVWIDGVVLEMADNDECGLLETVLVMRMLTPMAVLASLLPLPLAAPSNARCTLITFSCWEEGWVFRVSFSLAARWDWDCAVVSVSFRRALGDGEVSVFSVGSWAISDFRIFPCFTLGGVGGGTGLDTFLGLRL